jgi:pyrophosphatase PpaX
MKNGIRAVLYDFDGTLADSTELIMRSYRHTMQAHLGHVPPDEVWLAGFGMTLESQIDRFARTPEESLEMLSTYRAFQSHHYGDLLRPFPGAPETIAELDRRGYALAIVTSRHRHSTLEGMDLCGIIPHFPVIVTPEDVTHPKPHPEPVELALRTLGVEPHEAIFIGDSPHDMVAGRAAGTRVAAALWGPFTRARLEEESPDAWLKRQDDIFAVLEG